MEKLFFKTISVNWIFVKHEPFPWWMKFITEGAIAAISLGFPVAAAVDRSAEVSDAQVGLLVTLKARLLLLFLVLFLKF